MKFSQFTTSLWVAGVLSLGGIAHVSAQDAGPAPSATPDPDIGLPTYAYLKQEYVDAIKDSGLPLQRNMFVASFRGFDGDFAMFQRPKSRETIYIPKSAILIISGSKPKQPIY